jgi:hypothetical protein
VSAANADRAVKNAVRKMRDLRFTHSVYFQQGLGHVAYINDKLSAGGLELFWNLDFGFWNIPSTV